MENWHELHFWLILETSDPVPTADLDQTVPWDDLVVPVLVLVLV